MIKRKIAKIIPATLTMDGAGVKLFRSIGSAALGHLDPFLLLDEIRSESGTDYIAGFPDHPHRGFETVTYMLAGSMRHRDSTGAEGVLGPGSIQWMTAGKGIIHSEMPEQEDGLLRGFQLWINLPAKQKMCAPRYQDIPPEDVPEHQDELGSRIRILAGEAHGKTGPIQGGITAPIFLDVRLPTNCEWTINIPNHHSAMLYVYDGAILIDDQRMVHSHLVVLEDGEKIDVCGDDGKFLFIAAQPLDEPIARHGPFVMNTREEIHQAFDDYQSGRFLD